MSNEKDIDTCVKAPEYFVEVKKGKQTQRMSFYDVERARDCAKACSCATDVGLVVVRLDEPVTGAIIAVTAKGAEVATAGVAAAT